MISDEYMMKAAMKMQDAAGRSERAASSMDASVQQLRMLLEDGYGGNGVLLLEALRGAKAWRET